MKLVVAIVSNDDSSATAHALMKKKYQVTKLTSVGGFLSAGNTTLLIGCQEDRVQEILGILEEYSSKREEIVPSPAEYDIEAVSTMPLKVTVGGATVFVLDVDQFYKI